MSKLANIIEENGKLVAKITGEVFIIPNSSNTYDELTLKKRADRLFREYPNMKTDRYIQCWISSKELNIDNLTSIGFEFEHNGKTYYSDAIFSMIPVGLLPSAEKETSVIKLSDVSAYCYDDDDFMRTEIKIDVELTLTANQLDYRYRRFGRFEEVLKYVM
jgi:hypothetical protein